MKAVLIIGVSLMLLGGGLMVMGHVNVEDHHEVEILGADISITETERKRIPLAVSGTILGVGAALTLLGGIQATRKR